MISPSDQLPQALRPAGAWQPSDDAAFRWLVRRYESVTRDRGRVGDQLKAIFAGRDPAWGDAAASAEPIGRLLSDIRHGRRDTPAPIAGEYHGLCEKERGIREAVVARMAHHPVGPWLANVNGVGTIAAAQLLARLDRSRAPRPSSFWAFCGLATMPAVSFSCAECGAVVDVAVGARPPRDHVPPNATDRRCRGALSRVETPPGDRPARVATSRGGPDVQRRYDEAARVACHLIGVTMVRTGGTYAPVYREARERFERERVGWSSGRIHLSALRVMEKRFLLDLWHAWPMPAAVRTPAQAGDAAPGAARAGRPQRQAARPEVPSAVA